MKQLTKGIVCFGVLLLLSMVVWAGEQSEEKRVTDILVWTGGEPDTIDVCLTLFGGL